MRLTVKMKEALERLFRCKDGADWVAMSTAYALVDRKLASFNGSPGPGNRRTSGGSFPEHQMTLTVAGRAWCTNHYKKLARYAGD